MARRYPYSQTFQKDIVNGVVVPLDPRNEITFISPTGAEFIIGHNEIGGLDIRTTNGSLLIECGGGANTVRVRHESSMERIEYRRERGG